MGNKIKNQTDINQLEQYTDDTKKKIEFAKCIADCKNKIQNIDNLISTVNDDAAAAAADKAAAADNAAMEVQNKVDAVDPGAASWGLANIQIDKLNRIINSRVKDDEVVEFVTNEVTEAKKVLNSDDDDGAQILREIHKHHKSI